MLPRAKPSSGSARAVGAFARVRMGMALVATSPRTWRGLSPVKWMSPTAPLCNITSKHRTIHNSTVRSAQASEDFTIPPSERVGVEIDGGVATVTLQDQKTRNCLSVAMMQELVSVIEKLEANSSVKVVVLTHTGKVFSSGHNLKELQLAQDTYGCTQSIFDTCNTLMLKVRQTRLPIIASVSGFATAAGCQLVATADMCVAGENSSFSTPGVNIGLFCHTPGVALGRSVGAKAAMAMLLTGDIMPASKALAAGLVNEVVPEDQLVAHTRQVAGRIAKAPSAVIALGKETFYKQLAEGDISNAYSIAGRVMAKNMNYDDAKEGLGAFISKRPPQWKT